MRNQQHNFLFFLAVMWVGINFKYHFHCKSDSSISHHLFLTCKCASWTGEECINGFSTKCERIQTLWNHKLFCSGINPGCYQNKQSDPIFWFLPAGNGRVVSQVRELTQLKTNSEMKSVEFSARTVSRWLKWCIRYTHALYVTLDCKLTGCEVFVYNNVAWSLCVPVVQPIPRSGLPE